MTELRTIDRDMRRIAHLLITFVSVQLSVMTWRRLKSIQHRVFSDHFKAEPFDNAAKKTQFPRGTSKDLRETFLSINRCVDVIAWNTGWLAHILEHINFDIVERWIQRPEPARDFVLHQPGLPSIRSSDYAHTVLLLSPRSSKEGVVADSSYAQYSFDTGLETITSYMQRKTDSSYGNLYEDYALGTCISILAKRAKNNPLTWTMNALILGMTNNVIINQMESFGGITNVLCMSDEDFDDTKDRVAAALQSEFEARKSQLTDFLAEQGDERDNLEDLQKIFNEKGHKACLKSYRRAVAPGS